MPRLYREAPLNSIWEGSGNVQCLDVLRSIAQRPESLAALLGEIELARGADRRFDAWTAALREELRPCPGGGKTAAGGDEVDEIRVEAGARRLVERLALGLQASLLLRHSPSAVAAAFCAARLGGKGGLAFGTLPAGSDFAAILDRLHPGA
jgi:putative acyl-CoA dehydrogenase